MAKIGKYSLWLMPSENAYNKLAEIISGLSKKYSTPNFEPHVTLIGSLVGSEDDMIAKTSRLAIGIKPYQIKLTKIEYLDEYFKSLFVRVEETEDVMEVNLKARKIFSRENDSKYVPHLSLLYGNLSQKIKKEIIENMGNVDISFFVKSIDIFSTKGEVKDWHRVKSFLLK